MKTSRTCALLPGNGLSTYKRIAESETASGCNGFSLGVDDGLPRSGGSTFLDHQVKGLAVGHVDDPDSITFALEFNIIEARPVVVLSVGHCRFDKLLYYP